MSFNPPYTKKQRVETPKENPDPTQCSYYVQRKHRFCRTERKTGSHFCATHHSESIDSFDVLAAAGAAKSSAEVRVPCPINPNHTVYASRLEKHVKVCPDLRFIPTQLPYFEENRHAFRNLIASRSSSSMELDSGVTAYKLLADDHLKDLIQRIRQCYDDYVVPQLMEDRSNALDSADWDRTSLLIGQELSMKHSPQHVSLLSCINDSILQSGLTEKKVDGFLELGAGKGGLAIAVQRLLTTYGELGVVPLEDSHEGIEPEHPETVRRYLAEQFPFLRQQLPTTSTSSGSEPVTPLPYPAIAVVDMQTFRRKGDAKVRRSVLPVTRLRVNIKDLDLTKAFCVGALPSQSGSRAMAEWVAIGKHLCGACTEFALSSLTEPSLGPEAHVSIRSVVIASCCHHRCSFAHMLPLVKEVERSEEGTVSREREVLALPGTDFAVSAEEFAAMASMTSWAVCGGGVDDKKQAIGYACKRLIDAYRVAFLRSKGYVAYLAQYVPRHITEENMCIIARK